MDSSLDSLVKEINTIAGEVEFESYFLDNILQEIKEGNVHILFHEHLAALYILAEANVYPESSKIFYVHGKGKIIAELKDDNVPNIFDHSPGTAIYDFAYNVSDNKYYYKEEESSNMKLKSQSNIDYHILDEMLRLSQVKFYFETIPDLLPSSNLGKKMLNLTHRRRYYIIFPQVKRVKKQKEENKEWERHAKIFYSNVALSSLIMYRQFQEYNRTDNYCEDTLVMISRPVVQTVLDFKLECKRESDTEEYKVFHIHSDLILMIKEGLIHNFLSNSDSEEFKNKSITFKNFSVDAVLGFIKYLYFGADCLKNQHIVSDYTETLKFADFLELPDFFNAVVQCMEHQNLDKYSNLLYLYREEQGCNYDFQIFIQRRIKIEDKRTDLEDKAISALSSALNYHVENEYKDKFIGIYYVDIRVQYYIYYINDEFYAVGSRYKKGYPFYRIIDNGGYYDKDDNDEKLTDKTMNVGDLLLFLYRLSYTKLEYAISIYNTTKYIDMNKDIPEPIFTDGQVQDVSNLSVSTETSI